MCMRVCASCATLWPCPSCHNKLRAPLAYVCLFFAQIHHFNNKFGQLVRLKELGYQCLQAVVLVLNKCDLVPAASVGAWGAWFTARHPGIRVIAVSAQGGRGGHLWMKSVPTLAL